MKYLTKFLIFNLIILSTNIYSQDYSYAYNGNYKYFVGKVEPDSNWRKPDFDDASWTPGYCSIGYGFKFDSTQIDTTTSVYLRIKFDVTNKTSIKALNFLVDYDDGFVAYLNDTEIVRVNLGKHYQHISHDQLTDRSHEPMYFSGRYYNSPVLGYYLDSTLLSKCLLEGTNVLSVQVHNDSVKGSDLAFVSSLYNLTNSGFSLYNLEDLCIKQVPLDSSRLPIVIINTDGYGLPVEHAKYNAHMGIIDNGNGKINRITDSLNNYNGNITIEVRGEISANMPKKSFNIRTLDSTGEEQNVKLMGMPKDNDWILYGPLLDKSLIRNYMAMMLGRKQGHYEPRMRNCELILNNEFLGLYVLMENIKRDSNRVNISKLTTTSYDITGGYIVRYDKPSGLLQWVYPKNDSITADQKKYMTDFFKSFYAVLNTAKLTDKNDGFRKYVDEQSLLDYIIVNELIKNCDSYLYSTYLHKNKDSKDAKLKYGPLWDNDLSLGNSPWQEGYKTTGWQFDINQTLRITRMLSDTVFANELADKWFALRDTGFLRTDSLMNLIDTLVNEIKEPRIRNYNVWQMLDKDFWATWNYHNINLSKTFEGDTANMKKWLRQRLTWIDNNISKIYYKLPSEIQTTYADARNYMVFPNPFTNQLRIAFSESNQGSYTFELIDVFGRKIILSDNVKLGSGFYELTLESEKISKLSPGLYIFTIRNYGNIVHQEKMIKR